MRQDQPHILIISSFNIWPPHFGSSGRIYNFIKQLAELQRFDLTVLYNTYTQVYGDTLPELQDIRARFVAVGPAQRWAQVFNLGLVFKGLALARHKRPALILCAHLWSTAMGMLLSLLTGIPFILDNHNAEYVRFSRMGKKSTVTIKFWEWLACKRAAHIICVSEDDRQHLMSLGLPAEKFSVVVNAVDIEQYRPNPQSREALRTSLGIASEQPVFLFFGKLDYLPNAEALQIIATELMPRILARHPQALFLVCGYHPQRTLEIQHPQLRFMGFVPRIEDYINAADVVIVPLLSGSGTKLKIIQALSCYKPVVTTTVGAEGLAAVGAWLKVTDDWAEFSNYALEMLNLVSYLPTQPIEAFRQLHSWAHSTEQLVQVIQYLSTRK